MNCSPTVAKSRRNSREPESETETQLERLEKPTWRGCASEMNGVVRHIARASWRMEQLSVATCSPLFCAQNVPDVLRPLRGRFAGESTLAAAIALVAGCCLASRLEADRPPEPMRPSMEPPRPIKHRADSVHLNVAPANNAGGRANADENENENENANEKQNENAHLNAARPAKRSAQRNSARNSFK